MAGSGGEVPLPSAANGGEFLLTLLQKSQPHQQQQSPLQNSNVMPQQQPQLQPSLPMDPAVAAVGPTLPSQPSMPSNVRNLPSPWPQAFSPPLGSNFLGFPQNLWASPVSQVTGSPQNLWTSPGSQFTGNQGVLLDDFRRIGISGVNNNSTHVIPNLVQPKQQEQKFVFGSLPNDIPLRKHQGDGNLLDNSRLNLSNHQLNPSQETRGRLPPGFPGKFRGGLNPDFGIRRHFESTANKGKTGNRDNEVGLTDRFGQPGSPSGSNLLSVPATDIEESLLELHCDGDRADNQGGEVNEVREQLPESDDKKQYRREKESRIDNRGERILTQRMRMLKRQMDCRNDIQRLNAPFLAIYESLIPAEEEKTKQKQLLAFLQKLVSKEWPEGRLYLYGSCANTFGVSKSDIDICLAINEDVDKSEVLLKLADIFQSDNLQNVQALTRARVPIVKLMDPTTGISCDICINNVLAVINTKLLRDYGKIDGRLRQLAFIVKHWAKSRGVNETYQGTLSSYAYVLMCIHFLQQRRPAILPCLQLMEKTYSVTTDNVECAYFDQVEKLRNFGSSNKETISQLVWAFFNYWAYGHDYSNWVISVRTGSILSKREKDWTRRIGNDRHLICIEDPFETSHDLGRVVDKFSIRVLREEFERAAEIMQYDPNPSVTLFERYVPS